MPLFVIISGYFCNISCSTSNMIKRVTEIFATFLAFQIIRLCISGNISNLSSFLYPQYTLWYLLCLVYWRIFYYFTSKKIIETYPDVYVMVTTGTVTSADVMNKRLPERAFHQYIPIDNPMFTTRFVKYWSPDVVLWFESEFWPAMLSSIKRKNIPLILINGRISNKSFKRWQQFDFISKELLACFTLCLGQSEEDAYRLKVLGASNALCLGNLKYSGLPLPIDKDKKEEMITLYKEQKAEVRFKYIPNSTLYAYCNKHG